MHILGYRFLEIETVRFMRSLHFLYIETIRNFGWKHS